MRVARSRTSIPILTAVAGITCILHSIAYGTDATHTAGTALLIIGAAGIVLARLRAAVLEAATLTEAQRQRYAELGYKAAHFEAGASNNAEQLAPVVDITHARREPTHGRRAGDA